jgi:mRNA-degrading endonuclease RelE of RelBE toxin-antitoxin system
MCLERNAVKKFKKHCGKDVRERVENLIVQIEKNPYRYGKLKTNQRSARCGKYRIIFSIIGGAVVIDNIGNRSNVYNSL